MLSHTIPDICNHQYEGLCHWHLLFTWPHLGPRPSSFMLSNNNEYSTVFWMPGRCYMANKWSTYHPLIIRLSGPYSKLYYQTIRLFMWSWMVNSNWPVEWLVTVLSGQVSVGLIKVMSGVVFSCAWKICLQCHLLIWHTICISFKWQLHKSSE